MIAICMARQPRPEKLMPLWEEIAAVACAVQVGAVVVYNARHVQPSQLQPRILKSG